MNPDFTGKDEGEIKEQVNQSKSKMENEKDTAYRVADLVSKILTPQLISLVVVLIFAFASPTGTGPLLNSLQCFLIGVVFVVVLPISPVLVSYALGKVDIWVSSREARTFYFMLAILTYFIGAIIFFYEQSVSMYAISLTYAFVTLAVALINLRWKISVHTAGVSGPSTALVYVYGLVGLSSIALIVLVIWSRVKLKAHTTSQSIAGAIVAMFVTLGVYTLVYPLWDPGFWFNILLQNIFFIFW
ncbi:MAG: hypothetical protein ACETWM_00595 [Candidatus Lokiarchaeia archaeon]